MKNKFKKFLQYVPVTIIVLVVTVWLPTSCAKAFGNKAVYSSDKYNKALINTFDGMIEVEIKSWNDFSDGINIEVTTKDGVRYYSSANNIILIYDK